ncbi:hypothetical protein ACFE04_008007 [Oxalis oulophora]
MAKFVLTSFNNVLVISVIAIMMFSCLTVDGGGGDMDVLGWVNGGGYGGSTIAETLGDEEEFEFDSEISRRILATTKYISYSALQKNSVPCSKRGSSYYNCQSGSSANPYSRGCSAITRCRS